MEIKTVILVEEDPVIAMADRAEQIAAEYRRKHGLRKMSKEDVQNAIKRYDKTGSFVFPVVDIEIEKI